MSRQHLIWTLPVLALAMAGCQATSGKDKPATGKITAVERTEKVNKETGEITVSTSSYEEEAERSVADKGAESLLTAQKYAPVGAPFSYFSVGDEDKIVTSIYNQNGKSGSDIWIFSRGKSRLTKTNYHNNTPRFSTDGKYVYFASARISKSSFGSYDQNSYLWRMPATGGGGITRIGTPVFSYLEPVESPDGTKLLYSAREYSENSPFIWYATKTGSLPTQLTQGQGAVWASNDTVVFSTQDENTSLHTIWSSKLDGSELTQIIADTELHCIQPSVSPDGRYIAYVKQKKAEKGDSYRALGASRDVYIYDRETGLSQQITTNTSRDDLPQWSKDSQAVFFRSTRGVAWNIWKVSTAKL
ncbi:hypothetical protein HGP28_17750 [Vibrio sp. SM6]|uniref:Uncharacterized protein n=1 Tax=Vibrio agarilyticus TaxID=2726741 RepID=A0A7X8TTU6_9VIBR|nr:PD40 domain-containing protein [Vibrio agarilyticus]NLS14706.1 hypothetical protein [Vibrio agarilyticus]